MEFENNVYVTLALLLFCSSVPGGWHLTRQRRLQAYFSAIPKRRIPGTSEWCVYARIVGHALFSSPAEQREAFDMLEDSIFYMFSRDGKTIQIGKFLAVSIPFRKN